MVLNGEIDTNPLVSVKEVKYLLLIIMKACYVVFGFLLHCKTIFYAHSSSKQYHFKLIVSCILFILI